MGDGQNIFYTLWLGGGAAWRYKKYNKNPQPPGSISTKSPSSRHFFINTMRV